MFLLDLAVLLVLYSVVSMDMSLLSLQQINYNDDSNIILPSVL